MWFGIFSLGQIQRIELKPGLAFYVHDILGLILIIHWVFKLLIAHKTNLNHVPTLSERIKAGVTQLTRPENLIWSLTGIWFTLALLKGLFEQVNLNHLSAIWWNSAYLIRTLYTGLIPFFLVDLLKSKLKNQPEISNFLAWMVVWVGGLTASWGLIQYVLVPDTRFLFQLGWDDHYYRLISTFFDPGLTGLILVISSGSLWWLAQKKVVSSWWTLGLVQFLLTVSILLTYSRASYLAFWLMLGLVWVTTAKKIKWLAGGFLIFSLICLPFLPRPDGEGVKLERLSTVTARKNDLALGLNSLSQLDWWVGTGLISRTTQLDLTENKMISDIYDTIAPNHSRLPSNFLVMFWSWGGGIGVGLLMSSLFLAVMRLRKNHSLFLAISGAILIHSLFNNSLMQPFIIVMWVTCGLAQLSPTITTKNSTTKT